MKLSRRLLKIYGEDRVKYLNDLLTTQIDEEMPMRYGALLSPQGKILTDMFVSSEEGAFVLDLPISEYEQTLDRLKMYRLRARVDFEVDEREVNQVEGEGDPRGNVGKRVYGDAPVWSEAEYLQARINSIVPEFGIDFGANMAYPREWRFDQMGGIEYRKGCFVGQEVAARMRHKSELLKSVKRVFANQELQGGELIQSQGKDVGEVLSAKGKEALAFMRLKNLDAQNLSVGDTALTLDESS